MDAAVPCADSSTFGHKLSREEALAHVRLADFWAVVDFLLENEAADNHRVYGHPNLGRRRRLMVALLELIASRRVLSATCPDVRR